MVIDTDNTHDTIGGGRLEYLVIQAARELLLKNENSQVFKPIPLAAEVEQCCGGFVTVMLESFAACEQDVVLFGAGHVSQALVQILAGLNCRVTLVDNRPQQIPSQLPTNCQGHICDNPEEFVSQLHNNTYAVVFTHDHQLDYRLVHAMLEQKQLAFLGLIGSATKAKRFKRRLAADGLSTSQIDQLHCPVGLPELTGKLPMEVALSIASQLQILFSQGQPLKTTKPATWREIKQALHTSVDANKNVFIHE
jgi:xanthine dehydrogenase accessory factor